MLKILMKELYWYEGSDNLRFYSILYMIFLIISLLLKPSTFIIYFLKENMNYVSGAKMSLCVQLRSKVLSTVSKSESVEWIFYTQAAIGSHQCSNLFHSKLWRDYWTRRYSTCLCVCVSVYTLSKAYSILLCVRYIKCLLIYSFLCLLLIIKPNLYLTILLYFYVHKILLKLCERHNTNYTECIWMCIPVCRSKCMYERICMYDCICVMESLSWNLVYCHWRSTNVM